MPSLCDAAAGPASGSSSPQRAPGSAGASVALQTAVAAAPQQQQTAAVIEAPTIEHDSPRQQDEPWEGQEAEKEQLLPVPPAISAYGSIPMPQPPAEAVPELDSAAREQLAWEDQAGSQRGRPGRSSGGAQLLGGLLGGLLGRARSPRVTPDSSPQLFSPRQAPAEGVGDGWAGGGLVSQQGSGEEEGGGAEEEPTQSVGAAAMPRDGRQGSQSLMASMQPRQEQQQRAQQGQQGQEQQPIQQPSLRPVPMPKERSSPPEPMAARPPSSEEWQAGKGTGGGGGGGSGSEEELISVYPAQGGQGQGLLC